MREAGVCIYSSASGVRTRLKSALERTYPVRLTQTLDELSFALRHNPIDAIIAHPFHNGVCHAWDIREITAPFPLIPLIMVCNSSDLKVICRCIRSFVADYVSFEDLTSLPDRLYSAITCSTFQQQVLTDPTPHPPRIRRALQLIHSRFPHVTSPEDISPQLGISVVTFRKAFRDSCGVSFAQYVIRTKLLYAVFLAQNAGLSAKTIAHYSAFTDEHQFYRCFKKKMGLSFADYRVHFSIRDFDRFFGRSGSCITGS